MKNDKGAIDRGPEALAVTRRRFLAAGAAAGGLVFLGSSGGLLTASFAATPPTQPTGQIIAGLSQEPTVFMPSIPHADVDSAVYYNLFSALWSVDQTGTFQPDLVTEVPSLENGGISADGLNWRLKLNPDAKWHDGTPFTAQDVKFNFELIQKPDFPAALRGGIELITNIVVVGPNELTFSLSKPYAPFPSIIAWTFLVPKHLMEKESDPAKPTNFIANPVGTGPFKFSERAPGDHVTLVAHTDYHGTGPYAQTLVFKYIPDQTVLYTQYQTGEIDYVGLLGISPDKYEEAKRLPQRVVTASPLPMIETVLFNVGKPVFQDAAVREALYLATDKRGVIDQIYYGLPKDAESFLPEGSWAFNADLPTHEYNVEKANKLLDDAGWIRGADGVREKNGLRLEFTNSTTAGNHVREQTQQLLQQNWLDIGAKMTISNFPAAVIWGDFWNLSQFDSVMAGINFMVGPDPDATSWFTSGATPAKGGSGNNTAQYANSEVDALFSQGATTFDHDQRKTAYLKAQEIIRRELPYLPLFQYNMVQGVKEGLEGFTPNVNVQENSWNAKAWYWAS
ncbi:MULTISPECIES: peptide ABC transporter substrate-binding protein [unclassified Mesorhizobium]|uniref:peptide ABC transporter substrate-binding protein n=1 Tax=unclassified Mesorhizobium TaxID=325217 RepID=UPI001FF07334|nr:MULTISPECIES: peptide ABC transporter substrate-binding protein [unclassified Mesorhizobium]